MIHSLLLLSNSKFKISLFITPQDGQKKQDCEINAAKRWIQPHGTELHSQRMTLRIAAYFLPPNMIRRISDRHKKSGKIACMNKNTPPCGAYRNLPDLSLAAR
jgi:hypothetical protein